MALEIQVLACDQHSIVAGLKQFLLVKYHFNFLELDDCGSFTFLRRQFRIYDPTNSSYLQCRGHRGRDRMIVGFITTYPISAYHNKVVILNPAQVRCTRYNIM